MVPQAKASPATDICFPRHSMTRVNCFPKTFIAQICHKQLSINVGSIRVLCALQPCTQRHREMAASLLVTGEFVVSS